MRPDDVLAGRYRLRQRIAAGGMGTVWRGWDERLRRDVAIKVLHPGLSNDESFRRRFLSEAQVVGALDHPGIAGVHDFGDEYSDAEGDVVYLVMQLINGHSLSAALKQQERLSPDKTLKLLATCAEALTVAHERGVTHRDIKPGNILIDDDGEAKIVDFGIARTSGQAGITTTGVVMGTLPYIAPEQLNGAEAAPAGDIYSLGVVGYQCLAGTLPFNSEVPSVVISAALMTQPPPLPDNVPANVSAIIMRALEKDPQQRWPSAAAFAQACRNPDQGVVPKSDETPAAARHAAPRTKRRPALVAAILAVLLVAGLLVYFQPWSRPQDRQGADPSHSSDAAASSSSASLSPSESVKNKSSQSSKASGPESGDSPSSAPSGPTGEPSTSGESMNVPDVVGSTVKVAEQRLKHNGFNNFEPGDEDECVTSQYPAAGHVANADTYIELKSKVIPDGQSCRNTV